MNVLQKIIKEEVNDFLINEIQDNDIIDYSKINLQHEYDNLNRILFNNELPKIPLRWSKTKDALGFVAVKVYHRTGNQVLKELAMSSFFYLSYGNFKDTLAHEMIHVKQIINGEHGDHRETFRKEANRINSMGLGFNINEKNDEPLQMNTALYSNLKMMIAIILKLDNEYKIAVTSPEEYQKNSKFLFQVVQQEVDRGRWNKVDITVIESKNPKLLMFVKIRNLQRGFTYSPLKDNLFEELLNDNIIKELTITEDTLYEDSNSGDWSIRYIT